MSEPLEWTERSENEHHADRDMAHNVVYKRTDGKWGVPIFSMSSMHRTRLNTGGSARVDLVT
jgi:hypothetical protein